MFCIFNALQNHIMQNDGFRREVFPAWIVPVGRIEPYDFSGLACNLLLGGHTGKTLAGAGEIASGVFLRG